MNKSKLSPIELAKHIKSLKSLSETKQDFETLKNNFIPSEHIDRVSQIITGLQQEDEFAIICHLMGTCESISKVDQTPIIQSNEIAPDFLSSFYPSCSVTGKTRKDINVRYNCFVEVKSTNKKVFKISKKDLTSRRAFAKRYGLPLVFAVRFLIFQNQGFWVLMASDHLERKGRRIEVEDFIKNLNHVLFDDYGFMIHPHLHIASYYDSKSKKNTVKHEQYGPLIKTALLLPDEKPIILEADSDLFVNAILDTFEFKEVQTVKDKSITCVVSSVGMQMRILSDMLFRINHLAVNDDGTPSFDATKAISRFDSKESKPLLISRYMVEHTISNLNKKKQLFFMFPLGEPSEQEKRLRALNRKKDNNSVL